MFVHVIITASLILLPLLGTCRCTVELVLVYRSRVIIFWHSKVVTPEFLNKKFFCIGAQLSNITSMITISTTSIPYMYSTTRVVRSMKLVSEVDIHFRIRSLRVAPLCWGVQETVIREKPAAKRQGNYHSTTSHSEIARRRGSRACKVHTDLWILFVIKKKWVTDCLWSSLERPSLAFPYSTAASITSWCCYQIIYDRVCLHSRLRFKWTLLKLPEPPPPLVFIVCGCGCEGGGTIRY